MKIKDAYNIWSSIYDSNENNTRDLEARSLRETLEGLIFDNCLELGCGTGKNTEWLVAKARQITSVDFSPEMLAKTIEKIKSPKVEFVE
ncbi:MAG TPA: class I SAM-dependent methyltransferase [Saprospiraceae bacterium]|nr:class I SAM-dependent methyltransferase [Saprospiraceae bacterium]